MVDTILFDLDGTLLTIGQDEFIALYFRELAKVLAPYGIEARQAADAIWKGTAAMIKNDGAKLNRERFWQSFSEELALDDVMLAEIEKRCDSFYLNEFNILKTLMKPTDAPARAVKALKAKGYRVVLATNPVFPRAAAVSRLGWIGLRCEDFELVTDYANSRFCKPNLEYFREVLAKIGARPEQCLMVGNSVAEDMCAAQLGIKTYLVTGFIEGAGGSDLSGYTSGTIDEFATFAGQMPAPGKRAAL